jgi:hypothetical protein
MAISFNSPYCAQRIARSPDVLRIGLRIAWIVATLASPLAADMAVAETLAEDEKISVMESLPAFSGPHEGLPLGVPSDYDWSSRPVMKQGNRPGLNKAMTGWGHAFWAQNSGLSGLDLQLRNLRVYLCSGSPGHWGLVQSTEIFGRQFDADFKQNISHQALRMQSSNGDLTVAFSRGSAFHFWPKGARHVLPNEPLCGVIVTVQAREVRAPGTEESSVGHYLIGLGADYWRDRTTAWNGKDSNPGIAVGRLRYVSNQWRWYILNTATTDDTIRLLKNGFTDLTQRQ